MDPATSKPPRSADRREPAYADLAQTLPESARHVLVCVNPNAGPSKRQRLIDDMLARLRARDLVPQTISSLVELPLVAAELAATGDLRAVVAAGGDGTVSAILNALPARVPLVTFALGTENLLAKYLGFFDRPAALVDAVAEGLVAHFDAGRANGRLFTLMASCGLDAEIVRETHASRRGNLTRWCYLKPIAAAVRRYRYPTIRASLLADDGSPLAIYEGKFVFAFNFPTYALGLKFLPQARADDGQFDLCFFAGSGLCKGLTYMISILLGLHLRRRDVSVVPGRHWRLEADEEVPYQLDGDPGGVLPLELEIVPGRLSLVVSRAWLERSG